MSDAQAEGPSKMECGCSKDKGRNLIVCIDGTSNQFGKNARAPPCSMYFCALTSPQNTNVIELYNLLIKGTVGPGKQLTWYNSGIGTYAKPSWFSYESMKQWIDSSIDLAIAWNFEAIILDAYRWLSDVYKPGDRIFLFGFSRGAYQVRALAAMIDKVGLIYRGNEAQIPFAFELYADPAAGSVTTKRTGSSKKVVTMAERFKETFSHDDVCVHFVGVWDTVSSIGIARGKTLPGTTDGMRHVCYFRHALALDERRVKFLPEYSYGGVSEKLAEPSKSAVAAATEAKEDSGFFARLKRSFSDLFGSREATPETPAASESTEALLGEQPEVPSSTLDVKAASSSQLAQIQTQSKKRIEKTKEVWFAGTHSDIGGGNEDNSNLDNERPPLRWMCFEAEIAGLHVRQFTRSLDPNAEIKVHNSMTWWWKILEYAPISRLAYNGQINTVRGMHRGAGRKIGKGQKLHSSVVYSESFRSSQYTPAAELDGASWDSLRKPGAVLSLVEGDMYDGLPGLLHEYALPTTLGPRKDEIAAALLSAEGQWGLSQRLKNNKINAVKSVAFQELLDVLVVYGKQRPAELFSRTAVEQTLSERLDLEDAKHRSAERLFLGQFTAPTAYPLGYQGKLCTGKVRAAVFSPDNSRLAISYDDLMCIWDTATHMSVEYFELYAAEYCLAFSRDGCSLVSLSCPGSSRTCTVYHIDEDEDPVDFDLEGPAHSCALVETDDSSMAVCGDEDGRVAAYNLSTSQFAWSHQVHAGPVVCLAVSEDGKRVASGSRDSTVFVWEAATGQQLAGPFTLIKDTHEHATSLAFSADGTLLAVGSDEGRVRLLDAQSGRAIADAAKVDGCIQQVAVRAASDGQKHVVFATKSGRVCLWDLSAAQPANVFGSDDGSITVFSPDCQRAVTGYSKFFDVGLDMEFWAGDLERQRAAVQ